MTAGELRHYPKKEIIMSFEIKQATRQGVKPLIGLYGRSGSGKTMTGLLIARGLVGPSGRIALIDSESGRGSLFADIIPGGYGVIEIEPPFSPERYQAAFEAAESQADVVLIDSLSHEHAGEGGVLDMQEAELQRMASDDWKKREACKMAAWIKPKMAHKKFVQRILRSKCPLICCLRGEEKTHITKDEGKTRVVTDEFSSPIFDQRFLFELLVNFETIQRNGKGGYVIPRKITHPAIESLIPGEHEQLGVKFGEKLAAWSKGTATVGAAKPPAKPSQTREQVALKKELWDMLKDKHHGEASELEQYLIDEGFIADTEKLSELDAARLEIVIKKVRTKLNR
jgi:hypothetical protein